MELNASSTGAANDARCVHGHLTLDRLKVLGDDTRFAIYRSLGESRDGLTTAELAERLGLHPNTIRPHLDRMVESGLVDRFTPHRGAVGRPQHRFALAPGAPALHSEIQPSGIQPSGIQQPTETNLVRLAVQLAERLGASVDDARELGAQHAGADREPDCDGVTALLRDQQRDGFGPTVTARDDADMLRIDFSTCPFGEAADGQPGIACGMHHGILEGLIGVHPDTTLVEFHPAGEEADCYALVKSD